MFDNVEIPYGAYWSTPFAKWQGALQHLHALRFAAHVGGSELKKRGIEKHRADARRRYPNRSAALTAIDAVSASVILPFEEGLLREEELVNQAKATVESKATASSAIA